MFTLEPVKGRYISASLALSELVASSAVTDSYFSQYSNLSKVLVKLKSVQGNQEILISFSVPEGYDGSAVINAPTFVSANARDEFALGWILMVDKQGGLLYIKASQLAAANSQAASEFSITFTSVETGGATPENTNVLGLPPVIAPGSYEDVTVDALGRVIGGTNHTTLAGYGITDAVKNDGGVTSIEAGTDAERLALVSPGEGSIFATTDTGIIYLYQSSSWIPLSSSGDLDAEIIARQGGDSSLQASIDQEVADRQSAITIESLDRQNADIQLQAAIDAEVLARQAADISSVNEAKSYTDTKISDLVNSAPAMLDTLKEIADQLAVDENGTTALVNSLASETSARQSAIASEEAARQSADAQLQSDLATKASSASLSSHTSSSSAHGVSGDVVGTSDSQVLTNKTIDATHNTISNLSNSNIDSTASIAHSKMASLSAEKAVVTDASGVISASSVLASELDQLSGVSSNVQTQLNSKASSANLTSHSSTSSGVHGVSGSVVGTSDAQTLTNKTIDASHNTISNISNSAIDSAAAIAHSKMAPLTASKALVTDGSGVVSAASVSADELASLSGVTSSIQTQLDSKASSASLSSHAAVSSGVHGVLGSLVGTSDSQTLTNKVIDANSNTISNLDNSNISSDAAIALSKLSTLAASKAIISDASGVMSASSVSSTELGYLSGVTSSLQTQLNSKAPSTNFVSNATGENGSSGFATYTNPASSRPTTG